MDPRHRGPGAAAGAGARRRRRPLGAAGSGFLTGTVAQVADGDFRRHHPRFQGENLRRNPERFAPLSDLAADKGVSTAQPALAWLLHQGPDVVPIPGTRDPDRIAENAAAAVGLSEDELRRIEEIAAPGTAVGAALI